MGGTSSVKGWPLGMASPKRKAPKMACTPRISVTQAGNGENGDTGKHMAEA